MKPQLCHFALLAFLCPWYPHGSGNNVDKRVENYTPDYRFYHNLEGTYKIIRKLVGENSPYVKSIFPYSSNEARDIPVLVIKNYSDTIENDKKKVRVVLMYGMHAREFFPVESALYFLKSLVQGTKEGANTSSGQWSRFVLSHFIITFLPLMNPDGRVRLESTGNYCWRGNGRGVDLERNFPWEFQPINPSSPRTGSEEEVSGVRPFSERESQLLRAVVDNGPIDCFVSFHSGIRHIYLPYSDAKSKKERLQPDNYQAMLELAKRMAAATEDHGIQFKVGRAYELNDYTSQGTSMDYMAGVVKVPFSFTVELWGIGDHPQAACFDLFNPPSHQLEHSLHVILPLYAALFRGLRAWQQKYRSPHSEPILPTVTYESNILPPWVILVALVIVLLIVSKRRLFSSRCPGLCSLLTGGGKRIVSLHNFGGKWTSLGAVKAV